LRGPCNSCFLVHPDFYRHVPRGAPFSVVVMVGSAFLIPPYLRRPGACPVPPLVSHRFTGPCLFPLFVPVPPVDGFFASNSHVCSALLVPLFLRLSRPTCPFFEPPHVGPGEVEPPFFFFFFFPLSSGWGLVCGFALGFPPALYRINDSWGWFLLRVHFSQPPCAGRPLAVNFLFVFCIPLFRGNFRGRLFLSSTAAFPGSWRAPLASFFPFFFSRSFLLLMRFLKGALQADPPHSFVGSSFCTSTSCFLVSFLAWR